MADCMNFPKKPMDFIKYHSWEDKERIYTNGGELVTVFRVEQMLDHYMPNHNQDKQTNADRIRAMSDEELADFWERIRKTGFNGLCCNDDLCDSDGCDCCMEEWLQSEAE